MSMQGRRHGAYYVGYLFVDYHPATDKAPGTPENHEHLVAIPARVFVQSPKSDIAVSYFPVERPASYK